MPDMFLARFVAIVAVVLASGSFVPAAMANGKSHSQSGLPSERDFKHGWGWDNRYGYYAGPFYGRSGKGYFRCFDAGYGWHSCPHYGELPQRNWRHRR